MSYVLGLIFLFCATYMILSAFELMAHGGGDPNHKDHNPLP